MGTAYSFPSVLIGSTTCGINPSAEITCESSASTPLSMKLCSGMPSRISTSGPLPATSSVFSVRSASSALAPPEVPTSKFTRTSGFSCWKLVMAARTVGESFRA